MTTLLNGLLGGLLVGTVAAVAAQFVDAEPSATATVLERTVGTRVATSRRLEFAVRLLYGGLAGVVLVALELFALGVLAIPPSTGEAFGVSIAWSALLFGVLLVVLRLGDSLPFDRSHLVELLVYHLVYGLGFGVWIRMTWIT